MCLLRHADESGGKSIVCLGTERSGALTRPELKFREK